MAELERLEGAQIRRNGEVILDLGARGLTALRIRTAAAGQLVELIVPIPKKAPDWLAQLIGQVADQTAEATVAVLLRNAEPSPAIARAAAEAPTRQPPSQATHALTRRHD